MEVSSNRSPTLMKATPANTVTITGLLLQVIDSSKLGIIILMLTMEEVVVPEVRPRLTTIFWILILYLISTVSGLSPILTISLPLMLVEVLCKVLSIAIILKV